MDNDNDIKFGEEGWAQVCAHLNRDEQGVWARLGALTVRSVFQPIVSFSYRRIIGHEGLVRVFDAGGQSIAPPRLFREAEQRGELILTDRLCRTTHLFNAQGGGGWFFLNVHPLAFSRIADPHHQSYMRAAISELNWVPERVVIEVVEEAVADDAALEECARVLREFGLGIALDDFGAGHSNFDRVWRVQPDIVKLDRSFALRMQHSAAARRMLPRIVSLLHETGSLVLIEGVETYEQAMMAMDADVDFAQGYYFARPGARWSADSRVLTPCIDALWQAHAEFAGQRDADLQARLQPYTHAIRQVASQLVAGQSFEHAAERFIELPQAERVYLLDAQGRQVGMRSAPAAGDERWRLPQQAADPQARWALRPYFRRALQYAGQPQVTRPCVSMASGRLCVTVSMQIEQNEPARVVCGDIGWPEV